VFDGPLKPNELLQDAEIVARFEAPEDLASDGKDLFVADGDTIVRLARGAEMTRTLQTRRPITAISALSGGLAVALDGAEIEIHGGAFDGRRFTTPNVASINAMAANDAFLIYTNGSRSRNPSQWRHDLMELGHTGSVYKLNLETEESSELASGLAYAFGAAVDGESVITCESWRHRLVRLKGSEPPKALLEHLPGYPSRLAPASAGGYWLTVFCVRTQLVELVLRESTYRRAMIKGIDPDLWISPQLFSYRSFHEPMQYSGLKQMGRVKPWAPPRSYGLVLRLDANLRPLYSVHSRAGGRFHGIVAAAELGNKLFLLSKGDRALISLDIAAVEREFAQ
jgi:hypothetical protein